MFLQELRRLADEPDIAPSLAREGYAYRRVRQLIVLDETGRFQGCVDLADGGQGPGSRGKNMEVPDLVRTSATAPLLLADGPDYVFGVDPDPAKAARAAKRKEAFVALTRDCAEATKAPEVRAILRYLESGAVPVDLETSADRVTFQVGDVRPVDLPPVRDYWAKRVRSPSESQIECLVCGGQAPAADPWPVPIKGIPGGQTSGNQLASANERAFESYGLAGSETSPTCWSCAAAVGNALNWLIQHPDHHLRTAKSVSVYWTRGDVQFDLREVFTNPRPDQVEQLLLAPRTGRRGALSLEPGRFYLAELSASGARIVLRTWIETAVDIALSNLAEYFKGHMVVLPDGSAPLPLPAIRLALATARDRDDLHPDAMHDLLTMALTGCRLPTRLLYAGVGRCRVGDRRGASHVMVTHARAALLKLALYSSAPPGQDRESFMKQLEADEPNPAYQCGRLLAAMEAVQRAALGNPRATLTDRFYGAASAAPRTVYGSLLRNMRNHLAKLRKDRPNVCAALEARVTDIISRLETLPAVLNMPDQAYFALGYYHQRAQDRTDARAAKAARDAQLAQALEGDHVLKIDETEDFV